MNTIFNTVSERLELPVDLIESDETVQGLVSIMTKAGRSEKTIVDVVIVYLSTLQQNLRRDRLSVDVSQCEAKAGDEDSFSNLGL